MPENSPTASKKNDRIPEDPIKPEYETFVLWLSLPPLLRGQPEEKIKNLGVENELVVELLKVKNQRAFAERFGVDESQVSRWKQTAELRGDLKAKRKEWTQGLTGNVLLGLYRRTVDEGRAPEVKLWMQLIEEWVEASEVRHGFDIAEDLEAAEESFYAGVKEHSTLHANGSDSAGAVREIHEASG